MCNWEGRVTVIYEVVERYIVRKISIHKSLALWVVVFEYSCAYLL